MSPKQRTRVGLWVRRGALLCLLLTLLPIAAAVYFQEFLIFPYYAETARKSAAEREEPLKANVQREFVGDGANRIEYWLQLPKGGAKGIAIVFRANLGQLIDHESLIDWAAAHGLAAAVFNYPGMGLSEGEPSERTILEAAELVFAKLTAEHLPAGGKRWVIGYSIGTGPAGIFAGRHKPDLLALFAPYPDLQSVAARSRFFGLLTPFLRIRFPLLQPIASLERTDLIVATGGADETIPPSLSAKVFDAYRGEGRKIHVHNPKAPHDRLLGENRIALDAALVSLGY